MSTPDFGVPIDQRHFEDYVVGSTYEYGTAAVDEREAVAFARAFDPQPIHIDPVAAAQGPFGGLIASGWHTVALMMRLFVDNYLSSVASLASPGVDDARLAGRLAIARIRVTVTEARLAVRPDRGIAHADRSPESARRDGLDDERNEPASLPSRRIGARPSM
jgi:acyl dehydratase